ncbi:kinetochore protein NDC80 homolog [Anoplophora glabripennis]|uniref:kinetochore protein NDC80 homolog n=1 Tax=Anoplophora glabripennis TaxID=217634 RepID=UPI0008738E69|nr:kinetochore protein NDC80 homolog [Anoplophora glabripennis]
MFRRSKSSSNIPLPKINSAGVGTYNIRTPKVGRSRSTSRLSQREGVTLLPQLRTQRKSSLDRKSSTLGLLRTTPLHRPTASSGSLQRTTPTSAISQRTSNSRCATPSSCRKEHVTIQKQSTDKKWVAEQYVKVQNYIMSSNLFDTRVVDSTNIKPPSINNFIYVTGVMLMEIFPKIKINKETYKEVIPAKLKVLRYPGTLSNSVLKTVNTMHSWPQVIGMWSWLIDKVNLCKDMDDFSFTDHLEPEERRKFLLKQNAEDFLVKTYNIFNMGDRDYAEDIEQTNKSYVNNLAELLEVDYEQFKHLQDDVEKKREYKNKQVQDIENLKTENTNMESEIEQMKKECVDFEDNDLIEEKQIENELQLLQPKLKEQRNKIESTKEKVSALQEAIKVQPCTYQEKLALLRQIDELKRDVQMKKEKLEYAREIKYKFDHQLTMDISKIQSLVGQWNCSLMELSIKKSYLNKLLLREKGFHDPAFLMELKEVLDYKDSVEKEVAEALVKVENDLITEMEKIREVEMEICEFNEFVCRINEDCMAVTEKIAETNESVKNIMGALEANKISHAQQIKELQDNDSLDIQTKTISDLEKKQEHLNVVVKKFGQKMLSFFVEMHNQVVTNLGEMEGIQGKLVQKIEKKQMSIVEVQQQMLEILKALKR